MEINPSMVDLPAEDLAIQLIDHERCSPAYVLVLSLPSGSASCSVFFQDLNFPTTESLSATHVIAVYRAEHGSAKRD